MPGPAWESGTTLPAGEAWRIRLIVGRLDPRRLRFQLDTVAPVSIERVPDAAVLAINAG